MNIRSQIYGSSKPEEPILPGKQPKGAKCDELDSIVVAREESRRGNSRTEDRHRLSDEKVRVTHNGVCHEAELVNLSGGGAMVRASFPVKLWDSVELHLGDNGSVECAVRWIRDDKIGLEFAHETRLDCSADELSGLLREVIARSFPDAQFDSVAERGAAADQAITDAGETGDEHRREPRHPLIWSGTLHLDNQSVTVRVRNISSTGAMIECKAPPSVGAEPALELNDDAALAATVQWVVGDRVGLKFHRPFDMQLLARSRPQVAAKPVKWVPPAHLEQPFQEEDSDPWDPRWKRRTMIEISNDLEGFLKR